MELILLIVVILLLVGLIILILTRNNGQAQNEQLQTALRLQMQENREELNRSIRELRMEDVYKRQVLRIIISFILFRPYFIT